MKKAIASFVLIFFSLFHVYSQSGYSIYYGIKNYIGPDTINQRARLVFNDSMSYSYFIKDYDQYRKNKRFGRFGDNDFHAHEWLFDLSVGKPLELRRGLDENYISDKAPSYQWQLQEGSKTILNYSCRNAVAVTNKGDTITAFYTPEISLPFGPGWNYGLPGVILEINDTAKKWWLKAENISRMQVEIVYPKKPVYIKPE